jgi:hypothetical protein
VSKNERAKMNTSGTYKIRIKVIGDPNFIDLVMPITVHFTSFIEKTRLAGCVWLDALYVPHDKITSIMIIMDDQIGANVAEPVVETSLRN